MPDTQIKIPLSALITLIAMLIAAGIWLGNLQQRVASLEKNDVFYHGENK